MKKLKLFASAIIVAMTALFISCEPKEVIIPVSGIDVCHQEMALYTGESDSLTVTFRPNNATNQNYTLSADKEGIVEITGNKFLKALAPGEVTVTATSEEGEYTASCRIVVTDAVIPVSGIRFCHSTLEFSMGDIDSVSVEFTPENATNKNFTLSVVEGEGVVEVVDNRYLKSLAVGEAKIMAVSEANPEAKATAAVKVFDPNIKVEGLELCHNQLILNIGQRDSLMVSFIPWNAGNRKYTFAADKEGIVEIKNNKYITALAAGETTITVTSEGNPEAKATCKVTVLEDYVPVESIAIKHNGTTLPISIPRGLTTEFEVEILPENASIKDYTLLLTGDIVTLDGNKLYALKEGETSLIATSKDQGGLNTEMRIIVTEAYVAVESIEIAELEAPLAQGDSVALAVTVLPEAASYKAYTITSSDSSVVDVRDGLIYGISAGTAKIAVCSNDTTLKAPITDTLVVEVPSTKVTVAEFLELEANDYEWYELTGMITNIVDYKYGNLYLNDGTGEVYVYGVEVAKGVAYDKEKPETHFAAFKDSSITIGDELTIIAHRNDYNGKAQAKGGYYVSHVDGEYPYAEGTDERFVSTVAFKDSLNSANKAYAYTAIVDGAAYDAFKLGASKAQGTITLSAKQLGITDSISAVKLEFYAKAWADGNTMFYVYTNEEGKADYERKEVAEFVAMSEPNTNSTFDLGVINYTEEDKFTLYLTDLTPTSVVKIQTTDWAYGDNKGYRAIIAGLKTSSMVFSGEFVKATTNDMIISVDAPDNYLDEWGDGETYVINWAPASEIEDLTDEELFHKELIRFYEDYEDYHSEWFGYPEVVSSFCVGYGDWDELSLKSVNFQLNNEILSGTDYIVYIYAVQANDDLTATRISNIVRIPATTLPIKMVDMTFEFGIDRVQPDNYAGLSAYPFTNPSITDQLYTSYIINEKSLQWYEDENGNRATEMTDYIARKLIEEVIQSNQGGFWPVDPETWQFYGYHATDMYSAVTVYSEEDLDEYSSNVNYIIAAGMNEYFDICTEVAWEKIDVTGLTSTDEVFVMDTTHVEGAEYTYNVTVTPEDETALYCFNVVPKAQLEAELKAAYYYDTEVSTYANYLVGMMVDMMMESGSSRVEAVENVIAMMCKTQGAIDTEAMESPIQVTEDTYVMAFAIYPKSGAINGLQYVLLEGPKAEGGDGGEGDVIVLQGGYYMDYSEDGTKLMLSFNNDIHTAVIVPSFAYEPEGTYTVSSSASEVGTADWAYDYTGEGDYTYSTSGTMTIEWDYVSDAGYILNAEITFDDGVTRKFTYTGSLMQYN